VVKLIHGVRPSSRCSFIGLKMDAQKTYVLWLNRNTEEQAFRRAEGPVLGRLPHISLPKCVQSGQTTDPPMAHHS